MRKRLTRIIPIAIALGILAALAVGMWVRSSALDAESAATTEAKSITTQLPARYTHLGELLKAIQAVAPDRSILAAGNGAVADWLDAAGRSDVRRQITMANAVETIIGRSRAVVAASPKLQAAAPITEALAAIDAAAVKDADVTRFNRAVATFQERRSGAFRSLVASVFGVEEISQYSPDTAK
ncbi:MAG: hypothetical protein WBD02_05930 [Acidimicrobiia bacterium]